jgi:hypothetical protein
VTALRDLLRGTDAARFRPSYGINAVRDDEGWAGNICRIWIHIPTTDRIHIPSTDTEFHPDTYVEATYEHASMNERCHCYWSEQRNSWVISEQLQQLLADAKCHLVLEDGPQLSLAVVSDEDLPPRWMLAASHPIVTALRYLLRETDAASDGPWFGINGVRDDDGRDGNICHIWVHIPCPSTDTEFHPDTYVEGMYDYASMHERCHCCWSERNNTWVISKQLQQLLEVAKCHLVLEDGPQLSLAVVSNTWKKLDNKKTKNKKKQKRGEPDKKKPAEAAAAAVAADMTDRSPPTEPHAPRSECVVCRDALASHILIPCGHKCVCEACINVGQECPLCRDIVTLKTKVFEN